VADISESCGTQNGIGDCMAKHIRVGMSVEAVGVRNCYPAQYQRASFDEGVNIVAQTNSEG